MKFKMRYTLIIGIIFMMTASSPASFSQCFRGWFSKRKETQKAAPIYQQPIYQQPIYQQPTIQQPKPAPSSPPDEIQSVQMSSAPSLYKKICKDSIAAIPITRQTNKSEKEGKLEEAAIDRNMAVCTRQTEFMDYMEDRYDMRRNEDAKISLFALYDGHGGAEVAECAAKNLLHNIEKEILYRKHKSGNVPYEEILKSEIKKFDQELKKVSDWESKNPRFIQLEEDDERMGKGVGSTALIGLIDENDEKLYVANLGDTHGEMCCNLDGNSIPLSNDFDVINITPDEKSRIEKAKGVIDNEYVALRAGGSGVSVTRGLGDYELKSNYENPIVSYEAEIKVIDLKNDDFDAKYILFATDGAWPRLSKQKVNAKEAFEQIGEKYTDASVYYGSLNLCTYIEACMNSDNADNITVMVVNLKRTE